MSGTDTTPTQFLLDQAVALAAQIHDTFVLDEPPLSTAPPPYDMTNVTTVMDTTLNELTPLISDQPTLDLIAASIILNLEIQGTVMRGDQHDVVALTKELWLNIDTIYRYVLFPVPVIPDPAVATAPPVPPPTATATAKKPAAAKEEPIAASTTAEAAQEVAEETAGE